MKIYKKEYENVFERTLDKRCDIGKVKTFKNIPDSIEKYIRLYRETFEAMHKGIFDNLVKLEWLERRFTYNRKRVMRRNRGGNTIDRAKSLFVRNYVGYDPKFIFMGGAPFSNVAGYFDDFFPNFSEGNPFEEEYQYPFKYMKMEALVTVYQMEERMELLKHGEDKKMSLEEFKDFVINYISCYNEEHGEKYMFKFPSGFLTYVSLTKHYRDKQKI
jgi:hypothetical protein